MNAQAELERVAAEQAVLVGRGHAVQPGPLVDFIVLYHAVCDLKVEWPESVMEWGVKSPANKHVLDRLEMEGNHQTGGSPALMMRLIDEVLKAVNG